MQPLLPMLLLAAGIAVSAAQTPPGVVGCDNWPAAKAFCNGPSAKFERGIGYPQGGTGGAAIATTSASECCCACAASSNCNGWTLNGEMKTCFLKSKAGPGTAVKTKPTTMSGIMPSPRPPQPPYTPPYKPPAFAKNVLFLAVDDMRPSLGAYNFTLPNGMSPSPNLDKLAATGTLFTRAYVQYAYCSPSRNSFMTGRRPDTTKVWEFKDHFREVGVGADWVSMPQFFKQHGYLTLGGGKLYHPSSATENIGMPFMDWPASWTPEYPYYFPKDGLSNLTCADQGPSVLPPDSPAATGKNGTEKFVWCKINVDKDASVLFGQQVRDNCVQRLELASSPGGPGAEARARAAARRPFFLGCGFHKPHAPHYAPAEFYDRLPPPEQVPLPRDPFAPVGMPAVAWHPYADVSGMAEQPAFNGTVNMTRLRVYRWAYYASIGYTDYNIGVILDKLEALELAKDTVVVVFGDHGYQLGEHDTWAKMTNFELGVHIPLIIRAPWLPGSVGAKSSVLAEMVDLFPTLAALAGLPDPRGVAGSEGINGTSLAPVFADPTNTSFKTAAFSQFAKNNVGTSVNCQFFRNETMLMGYSIRTDEWRYTCWFAFDNEGARGPFGPAQGNFFGRPMRDQILGRELYDHRGDTGQWLDWPGENVNLVNYTEHADVVAHLHQRLLEYIQL